MKITFEEQIRLMCCPEFMARPGAYEARDLVIQAFFAAAQ